MRYVVLAALFLTIVSCGTEQQQTEQLAPVLCHAQSGLPDPHCTSGAVFPGVTSAQVCTSGYASSVRNVPQAEKDKVYAEYGVTSHPNGAYEVDHLISLEIGGSNDIKNLWPELYTGADNAHMKDKVENYLHSQMCNGKIPLKQAQTEIATNWKTIAMQ